MLASSPSVNRSASVSRTMPSSNDKPFAGHDLVADVTQSCGGVHNSASTSSFRSTHPILGIPRVASHPDNRNRPGCLTRDPATLQELDFFFFSLSGAGAVNSSIMHRSGGTTAKANGNAPQISA